MSRGRKPFRPMVLGVYSGLAVGLAAVVVTAGLSTGCSAPPGGEGQAGAAGSIERGEYMVAVLGCGDCHTPWHMTPAGPQPDETQALSGHPAELEMPPPPAPQGPWLWAGAATNTAFAGPWGISYATNLTPDEETGLGVYTEASFIAAMRTGKHLGVGRPILPPMPWPAYANMTDGDLKAVFAYLGSLAPIRNPVPQASLALPPGT